VKFLFRQRGVAAVELGLIIVPLLLLTFGVTEFGRAFYQYNALAKATRDATRFLSGQGPGDPSDVTAAQCLATHGNKTCTGVLLVPGLTTTMVSVCDSISCPGTHQNRPTGSGVINLVTVSISGYAFTSLVPLIIPNVTFGSISTTMRQVL
jgi:Flp pilus assembly protein TadG